MTTVNDINDVLARLDELKAEAMRLYEANGRAAYESGQYNGIKWAIEEVERMSEGGR